MQNPYFCSRFIHQYKLAMNLFSTKIIDWYLTNKRDLPWRETKDPYKIWISEIILQQTRVVQGYDYYIRFINRFPNVKALAEADEDEVMKYWQGLGYYSRCRNLHEAARTIAHMECFPNTYEEVRKLKGVGDYTAAAICSFAYDLPHAVVDGNVFRVISRWMGVEEGIDTTAGKKTFTALANELMDYSRPALYNQSIMDFGALQCTPSSPNCLFCPLSDSCVALQKNMVHLLPYKKHHTKINNRFFYYFFTQSGKFTFLHKREAGDIWQNLYEPPLIEMPHQVSEEQILASKEFSELFKGCTIENIHIIQKGIKHVLSHRCIHTMFFSTKIRNNDVISGNYQMIALCKLDDFPVSTLVSRFFSLHLAPKH